MKKSPSRRSGLEIDCVRRRGAIVRLRVRGHAGFAAAGKDIVCSAASAIVLSAVNGLGRFCGVRPKVSETAAQFTLDVPHSNARAQAVLETAVAGLEAIAASYPRHMRVRQAEVQKIRGAR